MALRADVLVDTWEGANADADAARHNPVMVERRTMLNLKGKRKCSQDRRD